MKRFLALTLAILLVFSVSGCKKEPTAVTPEEPAVNEPVKEEPKVSEFYTKMQSDIRPVAVMIDNDNGYARPQMGLETAYMIYEMIIEGGSSRFIAFFKGDELEKVGPIRSSRHYFLDYVQEHDAIYVHSGYSDRAAAEIPARGINNINGLFESIFWRDNTYDRTWHNHYTGLDKVKKLAEQKGYRMTSDTKHLSYHENDVTPENGESGKELSLAYANFYKVSFKYNEETKLYDRMINGKPHMSQTGDGLTAKNIIVYTVSNSNLNDGINPDRQELYNTGSGEGYYLTEGVAQKIKWSKQSHSGQTVYTLENGEPLKLNPGNTYVELVPTFMGYTVS